ncbi:hypothetical protein J4E93_003659 [Alternaria ventricosa]|uniref:uncharacterized protein n=1 Tax=Alternaria ventricosa TaxID=1187951 RepID=UPI0020C39B5C|nr:uncharacterized protein J4E93_003659 [Alternaria ventricosa]KAI4649343.1 hypothetical protein J4E93_003659 [Alternaria ventricosa]
MSSTSSTYHIPFPKNFLTVNTPVKKAAGPGIQSPTEPVVPAHGFLSNRPARHQSISSVSSITSSVAAPPSETSTISAPSSPATKAADSPVLGPKIFAPLAVNAKHALPPTSSSEMSAAERQRRMSFEKHTFLSNKH